jgi:LEA14-like dessication related protein
MRKPFAALLLLLSLAGCATLQGGDPLRVNLVGVEALPGQGLEMRLAVKLRVQNPNEAAIDFDGVALTLEVRGHEFASGVSDARGSIPRFGETVLVVPVTVGAMAILRQAYTAATGDNGKITYVARGKLAAGGFGSTRFESRGDFDLTTGAQSAGKP